MTPSLFVFRITRATGASSSPVRGSSTQGASFSSSAEWCCSKLKMSSMGSKNVSALPRAPNRCLAIWALVFRGASSLPSCFRLFSYVASMLRQSSVVMQGLAQIISMIVTRCSKRRAGA